MLQKKVKMKTKPTIWTPQAKQAVFQSRGEYEALYGGAAGGGKSGDGGSGGTEIYSGIASGRDAKERGSGDCRRPDGGSGG